MVNIITNFNNFKVTHKDNKIGIGTTNPLSKLHVAGDIRGDYDAYFKNSLTVGYSSGVGNGTFSGTLTAGTANFSYLNATISNATTSCVIDNLVIGMQNDNPTQAYTLLVVNPNNTNQQVLVVNGTSKRVGINCVPEDDLDVGGNMQLRSANGTTTITFYDENHDHEHGKLLLTDDGSDGSMFQIHTRTVSNNTVESKFAIDNIGRIALGTSADFGSSGYALISGGTSKSSWSSVITETAITNLISATGSLQTEIDNIELEMIPTQESFNVSLCAGNYTITDNKVYFSSFYSKSSFEYNKVRLLTTLDTLNFSGRVGACIFSNSSNAPDSRLTYGESSVLSSISGLTEIVINITGYNLVKGTKYWIGIGIETTSGTLYLQKFAYAYTSGEFLREKASFYTAGGSPPFATSVTSTVASDVMFYFQIYNPNGVSTANTANYLNLDETSSQTITGPIVASTATLDTLTVNGTSTFNDDITLGASSKIQLGSSYGTSGQVLTSNGSGSAPTWQTVSTPAYYLLAYKTATTNLSRATYTDITGFAVDSNASTTDASGDFTTSTGLWAPSSGVYIILAMTRFYPPSGQSNTNSNIVRTIFLLTDSSNNQLVGEDRMNEYNADGGDSYIVTCHLNFILYANGSTTYKLRAWGDRYGGGDLRIAGGTGRKDTFLCAYKIG